MKTRFTFIVMLAALLGQTAIHVGCQSTERSRYNTLASVMISVDSAMSAYGNAVTAGLVSVEDQRKVKFHFERYKTLERAALKAARFDTEAATPQELGAIAAELTLIIGGLLE